MTTCAVCQLSDGLVINCIVAEPDDLPQEGCQLIKLKEAPYYTTRGWVWTGTKFINPNPIIDPENPDIPTEEEAG
jgi:hypothetical protein